MENGRYLIRCSDGQHEETFTADNSRNARIMVKKLLGERNFATTKRTVNGGVKTYSRDGMTVTVQDCEHEETSTDSGPGPRSLQMFIADNGGLNPNYNRGEWNGEIAIARNNDGHGVYPGVFNRKGYLTFEQMAEYAADAGYISEPSLDQLFEKLAQDIEATLVRDESKRVYGHDGEDYVTQLALEQWEASLPPEEDPVDEPSEEEFFAAVDALAEEEQATNIEPENLEPTPVGETDLRLRQLLTEEKVGDVNRYTWDRGEPLFLGEPIEGRATANEQRAFDRLRKEKGI